MIAVVAFDMPAVVDRYMKRRLSPRFLGPQEPASRP